MIVYEFERLFKRQTSNHYSVVECVWKKRNIQTCHELPSAGLKEKGKTENERM